MFRTSFHPRRGGRRITAVAATALLTGISPVLTAQSAGAIEGSPIDPRMTNQYSYVAEVHSDGQVCTGTLIRYNWVITAAHCVSTVAPGQVSVRVGNKARGVGGQTRRVSRIIKHPDYRGGHNDIALLQVSSPVGVIAPARLAGIFDVRWYDGMANSRYDLYDEGVVVGWGRDAAGALPNDLRWAGPRIPPATKDFLGLPQINSAGTACAGDAGAPLFVSGSDILAGVLRGTNCRDAISYSPVGPSTNQTWITKTLPKQPFTPFASGDWNGDGYRDLVARHDASGDLWLYPGRGLRTTSPAVPARIGMGLREYTPVGMADWNRDGKQDLVVRSDTTGDLLMYPGKGTETVAGLPPTKLTGSWGGMSPFGIGDFDNDAYADVVARQDSTGDLWLYPGQAGGTLAARVRLGIGGWNGMSGFGITDFDHDGHQDVIARDNNNGLVYLYPGTSKRGLLTVTQVQIGNGWEGATPFAVGDWDGDRHADIVARDDAGQQLYLFPGTSVRGYGWQPRAQIGTGW
jgi:hypothetical protein